MTTKLPTKAQVVEAFKDVVFRDVVSGEEIASILVRAGLAEEPREEGYYWVRWRERCNWQTALWRGDIWAMPIRPDHCGSADAWKHELGQPHVIGPRIHPPKE